MYIYIEKFEISNGYRVNRPLSNRLYQALESSDQFKDFVNELKDDEIDVESIHWTMRSTTQGDMVLVTKSKLSDFAKYSFMLDKKLFCRDEYTFTKVSQSQFCVEFTHHPLELISETELKTYQQKFIDALKPENEYKDAINKFKAEHPNAYYYISKTKFYGGDTNYGCSYMNSVPFHNYGTFPEAFQFIHGFRNHVLVIVATKEPLSQALRERDKGELDIQFGDGAGEGLDEGGFADMTVFEPLK